MSKEIISKLFELQDKDFRDFNAKLIPNVQKEAVIGIKTPALKELAKELYKNSSLTKDFLAQTPHKYFEENQLHAFLICQEKDFNLCIKLTEDFLPYIDNWATCDQLCPLVFKKNHSELLPFIKKWLCSSHTYTVRFAIKLLMQHFLDKDFKTEYLQLVYSIKSDEYYIKMMQAWYFATALAKQYKETILIIEQNLLEQWVHNKTIQKARESYRITKEQKEYLKSKKIK